MSEYETTPCLVINLFSCTAKGSVAPFCAKIRYKICNDHRGDSQLPDTCVFLDCLLDIAYIADNSMDFSAVSRVNRRKFAYQEVVGHGYDWLYTKPRWETHHITWRKSRYLFEVGGIRKKWIRMVREN